jgi:adenylate kinase family enzyme
VSDDPKNPLDALHCRNGNIVEHLHYKGLEEQLGGVLARAELSKTAQGYDWVKGHFREGGYVPGYRRMGKRERRQFAPGLPSKKKLTPFPTVELGKPRIMEFGVHDHHARRAGRHFDLRIGDGRTDIAHSWAIPKARLPAPGEKLLAIMQPDHTVGYMSFSGLLPEGYGFGKVDLPIRGRCEVIEANENKVRLEFTKDRKTTELLLFRTKGNSWLVTNTTKPKKAAKDAAPKEKGTNIADPTLPSEKPKAEKKDTPPPIEPKRSELLAKEVEGGPEPRTPELTRIEKLAALKEIVELDKEAMSMDIVRRLARMGQRVTWPVKDRAEKVLRRTIATPAAVGERLRQATPGSRGRMHRAIRESVGLPEKARLRALVDEQVSSREGVRWLAHSVSEKGPVAVATALPGGVLVPPAVLAAKKLGIKTRPQVPSKDIPGAAQLRELLKEAEAKKKRKKDWSKILPAVGAVAGGLIGARKGKGLLDRKIRIIGGAGVGATTGWLPKVFRDAGEELTKTAGQVKGYTRKDGTRVKPYVRHTLVTGLPGAGKTTEGKRLSKELGLPLISLDGVAAKGGRRYAGTEDARRLIRDLDTPHVVEGTQLLGLRPDEVEEHDVRILDVPKDVLVDRLVQRGWNAEDGTHYRGEGDRKKAEAFVTGLIQHLDRFKALRAHIKSLTKGPHTVITGQPGSGKSTLARKLSKETGQPLVQLDDHPLAAKAYELWKRDKKHTPEINKIRRAILKDVLARKKPHVIEGSQVLVDPSLTKGHRQILLNPPEELIRGRWVERELSRHIERSKAKGKTPHKDRAHYERLSDNIFGIYRDEVAAFAKTVPPKSRIKTAAPRYMKLVRESLAAGKGVPSWAPRLIRESKAGRAVPNLHRRSLGRLGQGEYGDVHLSLYGGGKQPGLSATKFWKGPSPNPALVSREADNMRTARGLLRSSPVTVPRVHKVDLRQTRPSLTMDYSPGQRMPYVPGPTNPDYRRVQTALGDLHRQGYRHGDMHGGNVLYRQGELPTIVDWGTMAKVNPESAVGRWREEFSDRTRQMVHPLAPLTGVFQRLEAQRRAAGIKLSARVGKGLPEGWDKLVDEVSEELKGHGYKLQVVPDMKSYAAQDEKNKIIHLALRRRGKTVSLADAAWSAFHDLMHVIDGRSDAEYLCDFRPSVAHEIECDDYGKGRAEDFLTRHGHEHDFSRKGYRDPKHTAQWLEGMNRGRGFYLLDADQTKAIAKHLGVKPGEVQGKGRKELWDEVLRMVGEVVGGEKKAAVEEPEPFSFLASRVKARMRAAKRRKPPEMGQGMRSMIHEREKWENKGSAGMNPHPPAIMTRRAAEQWQ